MKVIGLDVSLTNTGYALDDDFGVLKPPKDRSRGLPRIDWIMREVLKRAKGANLVVIEGFSFGSQGRAILDIAQLGGVIRWALFTKGIPYAEVAPGTLKKYATGSGRADKDEMLAAAIRRLGVDVRNNNSADALWLRQMGLDHMGLECVELPKAQRASLEKVQWPHLNGKGASE